MIDTTDTKKRLREYLGQRGIEIKKNILRCPNHNDDTPSAVIYDNQDEPTVWCPVCDKSFDIFEVAGLLDNLSSFPEKLKSVNDTLGNTEIKMPDRQK